MKYIRYLAMLCAFFCAFGLCAEVSAVEVDSGSTYCFGAGDFSNEEIAGICITDLPKNLGALMLGSRVLREGDVLTIAPYYDLVPAAGRTKTVALALNALAAPQYAMLEEDGVAAIAVADDGVNVSVRTHAGLNYQLRRAAELAEEGTPLPKKKPPRKAKA